MADGAGGKYFVRIGGKVLGPFEVPQLCSLRDRGRLQREHEVSVDRRVWEPAGRLAELFEPAAVARTEHPPGGATSESAFPAAGPGADEWFYTQDGEQLGPVSLKKLKRLAREGDLSPGDLVWKEGLRDWIPSEEQPGLFGSGPRLDEGNGDSRRRTSRKEGGRSVGDAVLSLLRDLFTESQLEQIFQRAIQVGGWSMSVASLVCAGIAIWFAIKQDSLQLTLWAVIGCLFILTMAYVAVQLLRAGGELIGSTPNTLGSARYPSTLAARALFGGFSLSVLGTFYFAQMQEPLFDWRIGDERGIALALALQLPLACFFAAAAALRPGWLNISIVEGSRAGFEGIAAASFRLKLLVRFAAVWFGTGGVFGSACLLWSLALLFSGPESLARGIGWAFFGAMLIGFAGTLPICAYTWFIWRSVNLEVKQSILTIAEKNK